MEFPSKFIRYVGALPVGGGVILGADGVPAGLPDALGPSAPLVDVRLRADRPVNRLVVGASYAGAGSPNDLSFDVYIWESTSKTWFRLTASPAILSVGKPATPTAGFFAYVGLPGGITPNAGSRANGTRAYLRVYAAGGDPDGAYTIVSACDQAVGAPIFEGI